MDTSHRHTVISSFHCTLSHWLLGCTPFTLFPAYCFPLDYCITPIALLFELRCWIRLISVVPVWESRFFSSEWCTIRLHSRKWVKDEREQWHYWSIYESPYQLITTKMQYVVPFRQPDRVLCSVFALVIKLTRCPYHLWHSYEALYRMSPSVPAWRK